MSSISMSGRSQSLGQQDQDSEALSWDTAHHILTSDINQQFRVQKYFRTTEMFSQIFSTSISRHSFSFLTLLYTAVVLNLAVFLIVVPLTGIAMEQSLRFHTYKIYFNPRYWCLLFIPERYYLCRWRWHWWQCWKGVFVRLETSGEVRLYDEGIHYTEEIFKLSFLEFRPN